MVSEIRLLRPRSTPMLHAKRMVFLLYLLRTIFIIIINSEPSQSSKVRREFTTSEQMKSHYPEP